MAAAIAFAVRGTDAGERTMAGTWCTPLPVQFQEESGEDGLRFTSLHGDLQVSIQRDSRRKVILSSGSGVSASGHANFEFTHIHWDSGAVWSKDDGSRGRSFADGSASARSIGQAARSDGGAPAEQPHLFSTRQADVIIDKINLAVDIPLLGESTERKIFAALVNQLNPMMRTALGSCMPAELAGAISVLMDETKSRGSKRDHMRGVLKTMMKEPLVAHLHGKIDTAIPDHLEMQVLKKAVGVMIRQMVEQMVIGLEKSGLVSNEE